jgi:chromosome segregation ATPase
MPKTVKVKEVKWFIQDDVNKVISVVQEDMLKMPSNEKDKITFLSSIGYKVDILEARPKEPKKRKKSFTINNAIEYIKVNTSKKEAEAIINEWNDMKEEANKLTKLYKEAVASVKDCEAELKKLEKEYTDNKIDEETYNKRKEEINITIKEYKEDADKKKKNQLVAQRKAKDAQKEDFIDRFGEEVYQLVVKMS